MAAAIEENMLLNI